MSEHVIRLRGPWECLGVGKPGDLPPRVTLPMSWPAWSVGIAQVRLARAFGLPTFDRGREAVDLQMVGVPGVVAARLNGLELDAPPGGADGWLVRVDGLLRPRNQLVLDVDPARVSEDEWGAIALVIRPTDARVSLGDSDGRI